VTRITTKRFLRPILISLVILLVIVCCFAAWASWHYKVYIKNHLAEQVRKATDGEYSASIKDVSINLFARRLTVTGLEFWPDTTNPPPAKETGKLTKVTIKLSVPRFRFDGIELTKLIFHKELSVGHVSIWNGRLTIVSKERTVDSSKIQPKKPSSINKLMAGTVDIFNPDIRFQRFSKEGNFSCHLKGGKGVLKQWLLDPDKPDTTTLLHASTVIIDSSAFSYYKPSMLYKFETKAAFFNSEEHRLRANLVTVHTPLSKAAFYSTVGHRITIWDVSIPKVYLTGFDWWQVMHRNTLWVSRLRLSEPRVRLYYSYLPPPQTNNRLTEDPPRKFLLLPLKVNIKTIKVNKGHLRYTELSEKSRKEGSLFVDNLDIAGTNLTNIDSIISRRSEFSLKLDGSMLRSTPISASFRLSLTDVSGNFILEAQAGHMEANQFRESLESMALIRFDSFRQQRVNMYVKGNQNRASARLTMRYSDLKITLLNANNAPVLKTKPLLSLGANTFFVHKSNPEDDEPLRTTTAFVTRNVTASYLSVMTKSLKTAAKEMMIKHPGTVAAITGDKDLKAQQPKRNFFQRLFGKKPKN
jgi:hypothetical protein